MAAVIQPNVTFKMLIFVRDVIQNIIDQTKIPCKKIKIMGEYIQILIPLLSKNSKEIVLQLTELNKIYNDNIGNRTVCNLITDHILFLYNLTDVFIAPIPELPLNSIFLPIVIVLCYILCYNIIFIFVFVNPIRKIETI